MALSQVQCLDDNHVNPRTHESKPEFLYSEEQRLALEALLRDGREAFVKYLQDGGLRGFLSDPELETLSGTVEPYDPDTELLPGNGEDGEPPLSLHYWPELSDTSVPQMDLGWPDINSYRGVTRATVYTQPPLDGQAHIKEVVRRTIAQAQKVIAVVMDVFTDVDIFRDLLEAGFKRKVSIYIVLERRSLPHFLSMCRRANMHPGYLKHLRVRCAEGAEFCTRSCTKVKGQLGHRFMYIDGDKAVSGSYGFTWMASRLDRNLITVVTGQAVDAFDRLFRFVYLTSSYVDLQHVATEPEPEPEPLPPPVVVAPPSAADARKLYNPKYALVVAANPFPSTTKNSPKESKNEKNGEVKDGKKKRERSSKDNIQEAPPLHPGLVNLEKACLISYLPTWPEPDPPSDVIGFINIRDANKPTQVHLQRSEMFETSQAIRFSSPISMPKEKQLEVAQPRQLTAKNVNINQLQSTQSETKTVKPVVDSDHPVEHGAEPSDVKTKETPEQSFASSAQNSEPEKDTNKTVNTENGLHLNTTTKQDSDQNSTASHVSEQTLSQSSSNSSTPNASTTSHTTTVTASSPKLLSLSGSVTEKHTETGLNTQSSVMFWTHTLKSNCPTSSNSEPHTKTNAEVTQIDSHTQGVRVRPHSSPEIKLNIQTVHNHIPTSSTSPVHSQSVSPSSLSEKDGTVLSRTATSDYTSVPSTSCSTPVPSLLSSTTLDPLLPASSASSSLTVITPIPKPRTVQLVIKDSGNSGGQKLPEITIVSRLESLDSKGLLVGSSKTDVVPTQPEKVQESTGINSEALKDTAGTGAPEETTHQNQNVTFQERKDKETVGHPNDTAVVLLPAATKPQGRSDILTDDAPKAHSENEQEVIPKEVKNKSLMPSDVKIPTKKDTDGGATEQTDAKALEKTLIGCEFTKEPNEKREDMMRCKTYLARAHEPQIISYCECNSTVIDADSRTSVSARINSHLSIDQSSGGSQQVSPSVTPAPRTDDKPKIEEHKGHISVTTQESPKMPQTQGSPCTPKRPTGLNLTNTHKSEQHSPSTEKNPQPSSPLVRTPTPDDFSPRTPATDSGSHTPDPRHYTRDFRTPTPDISDGYISAREGSTLSTTSEEFYECDSPSSDSVFHQVGFLYHGTTVDCDGFTFMNAPNASPLHMNNNSCANSLDTLDRNSSCIESQSLSGVSASSSLEKLDMGVERKAKNEENHRQEEDLGKQEIERTGGNERNTVTDLTENTEKKPKKAQSYAAKRKQVSNQSTAPRVDDGRMTPWDIMNKATDVKRTSSGDLKPDKSSSVRGKPGKEKVVDEAAVKPSSTERRVRLQSFRDTQGQKSSTGQLHDSPSRSPPAQPIVGAVKAAKQKPVEVSQSKESAVSQQASMTNSRSRVRHVLNQQSNPIVQPSGVRTHSNPEPQLYPHFPNPEVSPQEEGKTPFNFTFSKLYNLKGLKGKISQPQSKKGGSSSPAKGHMS